MHADRTTRKIGLPVPCSAAFVLLLLIFALSQPAFADIGPKPTMSLTWDLSQWESAPTIEQVNLYACGDDASCTDPQLVEEMAAQRMTCDERGCFAMLYSSDGFWQLEMDVNGVTLVSAPFEKMYYDSDHTIIIHPDRLEVVTVEPPLPVADVEQRQTPASKRFDVLLGSLVFALAATLISELIVAWIYLARTNRSRRLLALTVLGNIITVPIIWLVVPRLIGQYLFALFLQFLTAFVLEALIYGLFGGASMRWKGSIALSLWANLCSELLGFVLFFALGMFV